MEGYKARYFSGRAAVGDEVQVRLRIDGVDFVTANGDPQDTWPYDALRLVDRDHLDERVRLARGPSSPERLDIIAPDALPALYARVPRLCPPGPFRRETLRFVVIWAAGLGALALAVLFGISLLTSGIAGLVSPDWEERVGNDVVESLGELLTREDDGGRFCDSQAASRALDLLTARMMQERELPYDVKLWFLDVSPINALTAPGGNVVLFRGLIDEAESPDEVAGVIAHELGHVIERHPLEGWIRAVGVAALFDLFAGSSGGATAVTGISESLIHLSYSRRDERAAELLALELLTWSDLRRDGIAMFFDRLAEKEASGGGLVEYFSTHPSHMDRASAARASGEGGRSAMSTEEWEAVQAICN